MGKQAMVKEGVDPGEYAIIGDGDERVAKHVSRKPSRKIKIGYFADGPWAHEAYSLLSADQTIEIAFICARYNNPDKVLRKIAADHGIDYLTHPNVNSEVFLKLIRPHNCKLFVSMSFDQIFKLQIINMPPMKTVNCHAGALPFYRGRNVLNWTLINDEKSFGITAHYVDEAIDTGDIILQRGYEITDEDSYATLLECAYKACAEVLYDAIKLLQTYKIEPIKQATIHPVGFYCGQRKEGDEIIDWNQTSREIFNFIRAICKPGPMARSFIADNEIKINKASVIKEAPSYKGITGSVIGIEEDGFLVKTSDSFIKIVEWEYEGKIKIGDRFQPQAFTFNLGNNELTTNR